MSNIHKTSFRQRKIDPSKTIELVKDIKDVMRTADKEGQKMLESIEQDLKKELYDANKQIIIPNYVEIKNNNNINLKNIINPNNLPENKKINKKNQQSPNHINTNLINSNIENINNNSNLNNSNYSILKNDHQLNFKPITEFKRPNHYIIYSQKTRDEQKIEYEASIHDINFMTVEKLKIEIKDYEKLIIDIENDIGKGELIPEERIQQIIKDHFPHLNPDNIKQISKFFLSRREDFKKSLLRKYWKEPKNSDKYLQQTFRRRDKEKMKTRKNKQNEYESLDKIKEFKKFSDTYLKNILNFMSKREILTKNIINLNSYEFNINIDNLIKSKNSNNSNITTNFINSLKISINNDKTDYIKNDIEIKKILNDLDLIEKEITVPNINDPKFVSDGSKVSVPGPHTVHRPKKIKKQPPDDGGKIIVGRSGDSYTNNENINNLKKIELPEFKIKEEDNHLSLRIRQSCRFKKLTIDRYIQSKDSFNPFDDDFNHSINFINNNDIIINIANNYDNDKIKIKLNNNNENINNNENNENNNIQNNNEINNNNYNNNFNNYCDVKFEIYYNNYCKNSLKKILYDENDDEDDEKKYKKNNFLNKKKSNNSHI